MSERAGTVILSPHLDDAVLSCGGLIYQRTRAGGRVRVVTLTAGDAPQRPIPPLAQDLRRWTGLGDDAVAVRRTEDVRAVSLLGAEAVHLELPECVLRRHPVTGRPLYATLSSIFGRGEPGDEAFEEGVKQRLAGLASSDEVIAPLGVGRHVDHTLVRRAAEAVFGGQLRYYEDFPYCRKFLSVRRARGWSGRWSVEAIALSEAALAARIEAVRCYTSQLSTLFGGIGREAAAISGYAHKAGGERLWRRIAA